MAKISKKVFLDVETTGLDPKRNGIVQIAGLVEINGRIAKQFNYNVCPFPDDILDVDALEINKYTKEQIMGFLSPDTVKANIEGMLDPYVDKYNKMQKFNFYAYNAKFDFDFMWAWWKKTGDNYFGSWFWTPPIDIMALAA